MTTRRTRDTPIFIIGYSGAGQMAVGATTYLREWVRGPICVISLGGLFGSDQGLLAADHVYHLSGSTDKVLMMNYLAPGRWPIFATSEFNRAKASGTHHQYRDGPDDPHRQDRVSGWQDLPARRHAYVDHTVSVVSDIVSDVVNSAGSEQQTSGNSHQVSLIAEPDVENSSSLSPRMSWTSDNRWTEWQVEQPIVRVQWLSKRVAAHLTANIAVAIL